MYYDIKKLYKRNPRASKIKTRQLKIIQLEGKEHLTVP